ncbi:spore coat protein GerQ [Sporolactobacillus sp. THM19-2]|uniref:spore coat protein GerQ n=1 Tax=Sporolactobacillus sp. THM19-2 TaxID=2511171 RepID=UPI0010211659|nr:spore coat protein GerQ [Sporolactobacillus sp. THM19-2]RYL94058.1 spore coat protein GerQ [Sporolactobacillus sp. THM19-2]
MSTPYQPESWPYGVFNNPENGQAPGWEAFRQQTGTGSFPFQGQSVPPTGAPAQPQTLPYPFPSYTIPVPPAGQPQSPQQMPQTPPGQAGFPPGFVEQSYIENILRLNLGKQVTVYATFEGNPEWTARTFTGTLEAAGRDHVIIEDEETTVRSLIPMVFVNYITFTGPIDYSYPFGPQDR